MRADATHRFEFDVEGGMRPPFICTARTRPEAEQVARIAGARVRLRSRVPIPPEHPQSDAAARAELAQRGLLRPPWRDDVIEVVRVLDHMRLSGGSVSVVPVAFLSPAQILERGLRACGCGKHGASRHPQGLRPVEAPAELSARVEADGGWSLHLRQRRPRPGQREALGWERCAGRGCGGLEIAFEPGCSVWTIALEMLGALMFAAELRPAELSAVHIAPGAASA